MTVENEISPLVEYAGNDSTVEFTITFQYISAEDDIVVVLIDAGENETTLVYDTHYTISGQTLTMVTPPATGETLQIYRDIPITQETDLKPYRQYNPELIEDALDKLTLIIQDAGNIAGTAADTELFDGLDSSQFLRSDQNDTFNGDLTITGTLTVDNVVYPEHDKYFVDYNISDHGASGVNSLYSIVTTIGTSEKATVFFQHNSGGNTTEYLVDTSFNLSSYTNIKFIFENGAELVQVTGDEVLTFFSPDIIIADKKQKITGDDMLAFGVGGDIYPGWFGAAPGTSSDSGPAIQYAITTATACHGRAFIPSGFYYIGTKAVFTGTFNVEGEGNSTILWTDQNIAMLEVDCVTAQSYYGRFDNIWFEDRGTGLRSDVAGIAVTGTGYHQFSFCKFTNLWFEGTYHGLLFDYGLSPSTPSNALDWNSFTGLKFFNYGSTQCEYGIRFCQGSGTGNVFDDCAFVVNTAGIEWQASNNATVGDVVIGNCQFGGNNVDTKGVAGSPAAIYRERISIVNCQFDGGCMVAYDFNGYKLHLDSLIGGATGVSLTNCVVTGVYVAPNEHVGIGTTEPFAKADIASDEDIEISRITAINNSYTKNVLAMNAYRAASSAFDFLECYSSNGVDSEFILRGDGTSYQDGGATWGSPADYAEPFDTIDGNDIPIGHTVVSENGKVRQSTSSDNPSKIIGVVRPKDGSGSIVASGKHLFGESRKLYNHYGQMQYDENGDCMLNPNYDPNLPPDSEKIGRVIVGLLGQIAVNHGQPIGDRWIFQRKLADNIDLYLVR